MSNYKGNENDTNFVQKDVFTELSLAENAVTDIYNFKEKFRVKTIYENFNSLYKFGGGFKFILSFITGSLAAIGFFFLLYIDGFSGFFNYFLMGLAVLFAASMSFGLEKARYTVVPIVVKSWLRDKKVQKGLLLAALSLQIVSISSTIYGTYQVVNLFYVPTLGDSGGVGAEQGVLIANYESKIEAAKADKAEIDVERDKYHKKSGKPSGWIEHEVYNQLTTDISDFEAQIVDLRQQVRDDKKELKTDNKEIEKEHAASKYVFVWVSSIVSLLAEILLSVILFFLIKYEFSTLKQLDTIQSPLQTVLNLVQNPLTALKSHLVGGNGLVIAQSGGGQVPQMVTNQTGNFDPLNMTASNVPPIITNQGANIPPLNTGASNVPPLVTNSATNTGANIPPISANNQPQNYTSNSLYTGSPNRRTAGFRIGENNSTNTPPKNKPKRVSVQSVSTDDLAKIELKILHYKKQVRDTQNRLKKLKQKGAILEAKKTLKNRQQNLKNWEQKKADYQGKTIA